MNIEEAFTAKTASHVRKLQEQLGAETAFGRSDVQRVLGLKPTRSTALLREMAESGIIKPVSGHGKGKYRFRQQQSLGDGISDLLSHTYYNFDLIFNWKRVIIQIKVKKGMNAMEYLNNVLGIRVVYIDGSITAVPNYIHARYRLQEVSLDGRKAVFAYPKTELDSVNAVKKHFEKIQKTVGASVILVPDHLTYRQKEYLLRDKIPFIVDGKQIYLPFMAVYLQERGDAEQRKTAAVDALSFTPTSISRASRQLEGLNLVMTEKRGVQKVVYTDKTPRELFESAKDYLMNPVKRTVYVPKAEIHEKLPMSGYTALSEYSMMNPPAVGCFAASSIAAWDKCASGELQNSEAQCAVELWRYDPKKLTDGECVDKLSLALALKDDRDERIEEAVQEMLDSVWRGIDGKRN